MVKSNNRFIQEFWIFKKIIWKYAANLQDNTYAQALFQYGTLLKSYFRMGVLLKFTAYFQKTVL